MEFCIGELLSPSDVTGELSIQGYDYRVPLFWSLLDMVKTYGVGLSQIGGLLATLQFQANLHSKVPENFPPEYLEHSLKVLESGDKVLSDLGLSLSQIYLQKILDTWKDVGLDRVHEQNMFAILQGRVEDELSQTLFMHFTPKQAELYGNRSPFGDVVRKSFPSCAWDAEEAARCLSVRRATASVFHLMRVMEAGLKAMSNSLGIPYAPSWESHLNQIRNRIAAKHRTKGVRWKRDEPFFSDAAARLEAVKVAWRNPTMHIVRKYTEEEASEVYDAVSIFMKHLARKIREKPRVKKTK